MIEYYSAIKGNEVVIYATIWCKLENIKLYKQRQTQVATYCMIPFIWSIQNMKIYRERKFSA